MDLLCFQLFCKFSTNSYCECGGSMGLFINDNLPTPLAHDTHDTLNRRNKNSAYGRHQLSRPMRIVGPIQFWRGCATFGVHFWPPLLGSTFDRHFWGPFLTATFGVHFWPPLLGSTFDRQWEAGIWSCDLRANERPQKKSHEKGQTYNIQHTYNIQRTSRLYDRIGPVGRFYEKHVYFEHNLMNTSFVKHFWSCGCISCAFGARGCAYNTSYWFWQHPNLSYNLWLFPHP